MKPVGCSTGPPRVRAGGAGPVLREARRVLRAGGQRYCAEPHPCRQYEGARANFEHEDSGEHGTIEACTHSVSAFVTEGLAAGFSVRDMGEWYGPDDEPPRLLSMLFVKGKDDGWESGRCFT